VRDEAIACLALADLRIARDWEGYPRLNSAIAFDAGLERYARGDDEGFISVRRVADDRELVRLRPVGAGASSPWAAFSPDGRFLAAIYVFPDRACRAAVWDLARGEAVLKLPIGWPEGWALVFSPDGRRIAMGLRDGTVALYDLPSGKEVKRLAKASGLGPVAFHPLGRQLALAGAQGRTVEIREVDTDLVLAQLPHPAGVRTVAWREDGALLAAGCEDHQVHVWETAPYRRRAQLAGHDGAVIFVTFSRAGDVLVSASWDGTTRLWEPALGRPLVAATGTGVCLHPEGRLLAFRNSTRLGLWEVADGRACRLLQPGPRPGDGPQGNLSVDISPGGRLLAAAGTDGVRLWDVAAGRMAAHLPIDRTETARFHPAGDSLLTYSRSGLCRWPIRPDPGKGDGTLRVGPPRAVEGFARPRAGLVASCWDVAGNRLAVSDPLTHDRALILDAERPADRAAFSGHRKISGLALSPEGRWLAAAAWQGDGVKVWDRATGAGAAQLPGSRPGANSTQVAFSPDGRWLVVGGQGEYRFWETGSWQPGLVLARDRLEERPGPLAFTRDGRVLAIAPSARRIRLVAPDTGRVLATLSPPRGQVIQGLSFSPDGALLAAATNGPAVQLWDLRHIGAELAARQFDWDLPPYPPADAAPGPAAPLRVEVLQAERPRPGQ
jgi:WD40 repeat protein